MINKIKSRLKFLHRKTTFLTPVLRRLICPALIQSHFDYASSVCFPNFSQKMKKKKKKKQIQASHEKYMHSVLSAARQNDPYF